MNRVHSIISSNALWRVLASITFFSLVFAATAGTKAQDDLYKKEDDLRTALTKLRTAIDEYKSLCDQGAVRPLNRTMDDKCYPKNLATLTGGIKPSGKQYMIVFLDKIPTDPMTGSQDWGLCSAQDEEDAEVWGRQNIYKVYSKSPAVGTNGKLYRTW